MVFLSEVAGLKSNIYFPCNFRTWDNPQAALLTPQFWCRCSPEPVSFSTSPREHHSSIKVQHGRNCETSCQFWETRTTATQRSQLPPRKKKDLTELQTEFEVKLTLTLRDKREVQTSAEREVLLKDFKMEGIHSCWREGLEQPNLQIIALLQEWEKNHSLLQKHHRAIQAHWKLSWKHAFCGAMEPQEIFFQLCSFTIQFSLLCYLLFNVIIHIQM